MSRPKRPDSLPNELVPLENISIQDNTDPFNHLFRSMGCAGKDYTSFTDWYRKFISRQIDDLPRVIANALPLQPPLPSTGEEGNSVVWTPNHEWIRDRLLECLVCMVDTLRKSENPRAREIEEKYQQKHLVREDLAVAGSPTASNGYHDHQNRPGSCPETPFAPAPASASDSADVTKLVLFVFRLLTFILDAPCFDHDGNYAPSKLPKGHPYDRHRESSFNRMMAEGPETTLSSVVRRLNERTPLVTRINSGSHDGTARQQEALSSLNINYYTLSKLAKITIAWTETASRHLELDARNKTLYLFCYPSFCALMCGPLQQLRGDARGSYAEPRGCFLDNLKIFQQVPQQFEDSAPASPLTTSSHGTASERGRPTATQFYKEILATYRVIFGQDKRSAEAYRGGGRIRRFCRWIKHFFQRLLKKQKPHSQDKGIVPDDLFEDLCGKNWQKQAVYSHIDIDPVKVIYQAAEFPFFYQRLVELQDFVATQAPDGWTALWHDRRDMGRYWAFWAVIYFSILTLVIGLWQVGLAFGQIYHPSD